jgi:bacteriorhodopsin
MKYDMIKSTLILSITIQLLSGLFQIIPLFMAFAVKKVILLQLLYLDLFVQFIQFVFYSWWAISYDNVKNITSLRYIDWAITTPTMLFTLIIYILYVNNQTVNYNLYDTFKENGETIGIVILLNWVMLYIGYKGEIGDIHTYLSVLLGFIPFLIYFYIIYHRYLLDSNDTGNLIFYYFFIVWSVYGVAALFSYNIKNAFYNILDVFSKNFFGIYIAYLLLFGG